MVPGALLRVTIIVIVIIVRAQSTRTR